MLSTNGGFYCIFVCMSVCVCVSCLVAHCIAIILMCKFVQAHTHMFNMSTIVTVLMVTPVPHKEKPEAIVSAILIPGPRNAPHLVTHKIHQQCNVLMIWSQAQLVTLQAYKQEAIVMFLIRDPRNGRQTTCQIDFR